eukprot:gb/GECG01003769.1/.p1 GENE.gb/GECG01003769.1/~~gb/GECG01003769.1/.p1  ORF type:complete len:171 (+),score=25.49 gb/GECG01003769.1/:1-513(+)
MSESVSSAASSSVEAPPVENLENFAEEQDIDNALNQILQWKQASEDAPNHSTEDWAQNHYTTVCIRRLCRYAPERLYPHLDQTFQIPLSMVNNLRSAVSRNALFCIKELIETSKEFLHENPQCQNRIVDGLIPRMSSEKKIHLHGDDRVLDFVGKRNRKCRLTEQVLELL